MSIQLTVGCAHMKVKYSFLIPKIALPIRKILELFYCITFSPPRLLSTTTFLYCHRRELNSIKLNFIKLGYRKLKS